jgi:hypothetical protein
MSSSIIYLIKFGGGESSPFAFADADCALFLSDDFIRAIPQDLQSFTYAPKLECIFKKIKRFDQIQSA